MGQVQIRPCTPEDLDAVLDLERQWEQEEIAFGDFNPMSWEMFRAVLDRFPAYFLVAEHEGRLIGYIHGAVQRSTPIEVIPAQEPYVEIENLYVRREERSRDRARSSADLAPACAGCRRWRDGDRGAARW